MGIVRFSINIPWMRILTCRLDNRDLTASCIPGGSHLEYTLGAHNVPNGNAGEWAT